MHKFGKIVLTKFPFTDLSSFKIRPALIISKNNMSHDDVVVAFITTTTSTKPKVFSKLIESNSDTGLKANSSVRFDKLATLSKTIILGELGEVSSKWLEEGKDIFQSVFGFN